ncbi:HD domain-containing phosphohydrolase [Acidithiobacillus sp.]|uniref:HD-GYP domain-containing protein n=1 Tax=Acidithiobacillus sp. TaxID=1872118 RepID=UPI00230F9EA7|nr:HD domain-containing phosphohydrolase [Acidithiobacillus sp.]MDA8151953.1 hypothetical protein [Acidithiobacillus sp.]MDA8247161.1 hypothetical protein [Acidithiobacillus sp.]
MIQTVRHHHEHVDGTAYPDGLKGKFIPIWSRILLVVDYYDALASTRARWAALSHESKKAPECIKF